MKVRPMRRLPGEPDHWADSPGQATRMRRLFAWPLLLLVTGAWNPLMRENEHASKAAAALRHGKADKAVKLYRKAMRELGERPELKYDLGAALAAAGKDEEAEKAYLEASTRGDRKLRIRARYNLGNSYARLAAKKAAEGTKSLTAAFAVLKKLGEVPDKPTKDQCKQFKQAVQAYQNAAGRFSEAKALDQKAFFEYKEVLLRSPGHFKAKWNLELALRGMEQAKGVETQAKRLSEEYARKCEKNKKKQDKKNEDKKNQNKKNQDKKNRNKKQQDRKNQDKKQQPKNQGDKKNEPRQQKKQQQKQQKKQQKERQQNRRQQVERQLDRFERTQRKMQRRMNRGGVRRRVVKDW